MAQLATHEFATRRRTELFDALVELFLVEGFAQLTLDDIASTLRCSKSTLYTLASSKEQLVRAATVHFFRRATETVEAQLRSATEPADRIATYLSAVGTTLGAASDRFMADLDSFPPAREVYETNTRIAADRVRQLIVEGVNNGRFRTVDVEFVADMVSTMMVRIQQGGVRSATGLGDAEAYRELAAFLTAALAQ